MNKSDLTDTPSAASGKWMTLSQRSLSTVILLALVGGAIAWGHMWGYRLMVCFFCLLASWEWARMLSVSGKPGQPLLSFAFGAAYPVVLSFVCARFHGSGGLMVSMAFAPAAVILLAVVSFIWEMRRSIVGSRSMRSVGNTIVSFLFPVWLFSFSIPMMELVPPGLQGEGLPYGVIVVLWLVLFTKMTDIFAYVSGLAAGGRIFANRKLIPHISPKKTWEGLIGSYILSLGVGGWLSVEMGVFAGYSLISFVLMTIIFILAVTGDLAGSLIKRSLSIKDSGSLLPGIGGVFDLIDSPAFTVPVMLYVDYCLRLAGGAGVFTNFANFG